MNFIKKLFGIKDHCAQCGEEYHFVDYADIRMEKFICNECFI